MTRYLKLTSTAAVVLAWALTGSSAWAQRAESEPSGDLAPFYRQLEEAIRSGRAATYRQLLSPTLARMAATQRFLTRNLVAGVTQVTVNEMARLPLTDAPPGNGYGVLIEVLTEQRLSGDVATWLLNVRRDVDPATGIPLASDGQWRIVGQERLTSAGGLYKLWLHTERQYDVADLTIEAADFTLSLPVGAAFVADTDFGVTGLVLLGRGSMVFAPPSPTEQGQLRIFAGEDRLATEFSSAFLRLNPNDFERYVPQEALIERVPQARQFRVAQELFDELAPESFTVDLGGLSAERWWVVPNEGDLLAEVQTPRFGNLTYVRTGRKAEDIQLFDRKGTRNISVYASEEKLATRGRFYSEDDLVDYDILDYDLDLRFDPEREWIEGRATLSIQAVEDLTSLTIRLADELQVQAVGSDPFGQLFAIRTPGQNSMLLSLPSVLRQGRKATVTVDYAGRLEAEQAEHQAILPRQSPFESAPFNQFARARPEPHYLYSSGRPWYPQSTVTDYATARLHVTVPEGMEAIASGQLVSEPVMEVGDAPARRYDFVASQPVRYLAVVMSEFEEVGTSRLSLAEATQAALGPEGTTIRGPGLYYESLRLDVEANLGQRRRARAVRPKAEDILRFYSGIVGDVPYSGLTIALAEGSVPGGHSPAYVSMLNQPLRSTDVLWERDPVYFWEFPDFFLAHELAHQWWGQAVGWSNYHEQWLSEGFAQYFGALYAQHVGGDRLFESMLRQMGEWARSKSDQGPIYLGYRLGHVQQDRKVYRSLVYNKAALVLHMARRLIGDEAFFRGIRQFYFEWRFRKAGSEDLRRALESESGISLARFFERWIYEQGVPELSFRHQVERTPTDLREGSAPEAASHAILRFEQLSDALYDVPVTVTLEYTSGESHSVVVKVTDRVTEVREPLLGVLRNVRVNRDHAALAHIESR